MKRLFPSVKPDATAEEVKAVAESDDVQVFQQEVSLQRGLTRA